MTLQVISAMFLSFAIGIVVLPFLINFLNREKVDQTEREYIESHKKKNGTPTMGGIAILVAVTVTSIVFGFNFPRIIPVQILTLGFGLIGFLDDFLKVILKRADGLLAWQKMLLQIVVTAVFAVYITQYSHVSLLLRLPFTGGKMWAIGWFHRWIRRPGIYCNTCRCTLFRSCIHCTEGWRGANGYGHGWRIDGFLVLQLSSSEGFHGRYRLPGIGRIRSRYGLHASDASIHSDYRNDLSD